MGLCAPANVRVLISAKPLAAAKCQRVLTNQVTGVFLKRWCIWNLNIMFATNSFGPAGARKENGEKRSICPSPEGEEAKRRGGEEARRRGEEAKRRGEEPTRRRNIVFFSGR